VVDVFSSPDGASAHRAHFLQSAAYYSTLHHVVTEAGGLTLQHRTANHSTAKPDKGSLELTEEIIRLRAYRFFEKRGYEHGHNLEDWLRAKAEVFGKKPAAEAEDTEGGSRAVVA
jgi:hypothetical protein